MRLLGDPLLNKGPPPLLLFKTWANVRHLDGNVPSRGKQESKIWASARRLQLDLADLRCRFGYQQFPHGIRAGPRVSQVTSRLDQSSIRQSLASVQQFGRLDFPQHASLTQVEVIDSAIVTVIHRAEA